MSNRIGLFGGTFDPPHTGHLIMAESLRQDAGLEQVIFLPSGQPPHKIDWNITPAPHRLEMVRLAIAGNPQFTLSDWELTQPGPCYTLETAKYFKNRFPDQKFCWLIGSDSLADLPTWHGFEELITTIDILTAQRGGFALDTILNQVSDEVSRRAFDKLKANIVRTPTIEIASRNIRRRVKRGQDIRYLVPEAVRDYILREGLYR